MEVNMNTRDMYAISPRRTICEVLREIFLSTGATPEIQEKSMEATVMAKKMNAKLIEYKADWDVGFFEPNPEFTKLHQAGQLTMKEEG